MIVMAQPLLGVEEEAAIREVIASGQLAQGLHVLQFEQRFAQFCQVREAIAVSSGTAALHLALLAHNIGPGDEVITSAFSFAATANAILYVGAIPVFVDIDPATYNLDCYQVERALTRRTRAILPVHLYGHPCDMIYLYQLASAYSLLLIEDACQAHGASIGGRLVGSFGTGCFSFYATKNMTTGEGGMITTNDAALAEQLRILRNQGQIERYRQITLGYNMRMTEIAAAIGLVQLEKLPYFTEKRIAHANFLNKLLQNVVQTPVVYPGYHHVFHQYTIRIPHERDSCQTRLHEQGIGASIHYPTPIHRQPFYQRSPSLFRVLNPGKRKQVRGGNPTASLPETELAAQQVISLPIHPALNEAELAIVAREVINICK